ncbi:MAG TPA: molybdate ABC transporter substrate-binding protein [Usitatibacter sp.]|nr:molybdate ABC transporter substrate-binding protein [Usitatibacter sp.]
MLRIAILAFTLALTPVAWADNVTVFAAASLKEALDAAVHSFEASSGNKVTVSYAGSNALAKQIESGAPADLFISADTDWIDYVESRNLIVPGSRRTLLANDLVLIAPATSTVQVKLAPGVNIAAILGDKRIALANPDAVPAGKYAKAAFTALDAWPAIESKVAAADNVRAALVLVARGEAPLGVVYRTDAMAEKNVRVVDTFPAGTHPPIVYPIVVLKRTTTTAAPALAKYLEGAEARATFEKFGFRAP